MSVARGKQKARRACVPSQASYLRKASYLGLNPPKYWTHLHVVMSLPPNRHKTPRASLPLESCARPRVEHAAGRCLVPARSVVPSCPNTDKTHPPLSAAHGSRMTRTELASLPVCSYRGVPATLSAGLQLPRSTCAVVGSADILRLAPQGRAIDAHKLVWRLNNAPTVGFESQVGRHTSVRILNHVSIEKWVLRARNRSGLLSTVDGSEYDRLLCKPDELDVGCFLSRANSADRTATFERKLTAFRQFYPTHAVRPVSRELQAYGHACNKELHGSQPSTGLIAVLFALSVCSRPVDLYGFWPFCCRAHGGWPRMNYKYAHTNRTQFVCCSKHREKFEAEFAFYRTLERLGIVRLHASPKSRTTGSSVGPPPIW